MKPIKMLGLAALAALMAMAFVGASSAMAEPASLCSADPCESSESAITHVHETSVGKAKLLSSINVECDVLFLGEVTEEGAPIVISGNFTYTECGSCEVEEESGPSEIKVLKEGHETGSVTGEGLVHVSCSGFINCSYNGVGLKGTAKGALLSSQKNGEVTLSEQTTNKETGGFLCPAKAKLDITTTSLVATYIIPWKHVCVFVGTNNGFYLNSNGAGTACVEQHATRKGSYELGQVRPWIGRGVHTCAYVGTNNGFYLLSNLFNTECTMSDSPTRSGFYELGKTA